MLPKSLIENFTIDYGRMNAIEGNELPLTNFTNQTSILQAYTDPPVELIKVSLPGTPIGSLDDGTQIWKFTHNGVDTHGIHFHLFNVQIINRVGWDGAIKPPEAFELGWKDTVRMNPLEDIIVAIRPIAMTNHNFTVPLSKRLLNPSLPAGSAMGFGNVSPLGTPSTVTNQEINFGWEYVYHCHLLGHEENDMMRPLCFVMPPTGGAPSNLNATVGVGGVKLTWKNNANAATCNGILIERATNAGFTLPAPLDTFFVAGATTTTFTDTTAVAGTQYWYRAKAANTVGVQSTTGTPFTDYPTLTAATGPSNTVNITA